MKKRLISLLLAVCLCVGLLPLPSSAAQLAGLQKELEHFLVTVCGFQDKNHFFDSQKATHAIFDGKNYLEAVLTQRNSYGYLDSLYPGEKYQSVWGEKDPLDRFAIDEITGYAKVNAEKVHWVLTNIFNISENDYKQMDERIVNGKNAAIYKLNGYYYYPIFPIGGPGWDFCGFRDIEQVGSRYQVTFWYGTKNGNVNYNMTLFYAIVEPKTIDGSTYWSIYYETPLKSGQDPIASGGFLDVPANSYFTDSIKWAVENGITNGTSTTTFSPNAACTRGQIVTFLWNAVGKPEPSSTRNPFVDVSASAYYCRLSQAKMLRSMWQSLMYGPTIPIFSIVACSL